MDTLFTLLCPITIGAWLVCCVRMLAYRTNGRALLDTFLVALATVFLIPLWNRYLSSLDALSFLQVRGLPTDTYWLIGPLTYAYIKHYYAPSRQPLGYCIHLTPLLVFWIYRRFHPTITHFDFSAIIITWNIVTVTYLIAVQRLIINSEKVERQFESSAKLPMARWARLMLYSLAAFVVADVVLGTMMIFKLPVPQAAFTYFDLFRVVFIICIVALVQFGSIYSQPSKDVHSGYRLAERTRLTADAAAHLHTYLDRLMNETKLYQNPELSLTELSAAVGITKHELSELLNQHMHTTFYDYINHLRVEEATSLMLTRPDLPVTDVAYACGYNSRSAFYKCFKNQYGVTPTQYRKQHIPLQS